ncbi:hypothetical protein CRM22_010192 [Opisthorchis felineus]|uniref:Uncharacterized protein n=1 Tax=Opisthorchis felineus TaxID=147828 RepID=A0A4S2L0X4_OPIFE|nr:hypothetical protein CRM22_010192 [Opisthorchis felineus]
MAHSMVNEHHGPIIIQPKQIPFRDWHDGLFGCRNDWKSCLYVTFCTPCYICYMYERYGECLLGSLVTPASVMMLRTFHRGRERIYGSLFKDCLHSTLCPWCVLCQLDRDMKYVEATKGYLDV